MEHEPKRRRFMYHSFPRRRSSQDVHKKGLAILQLIAEYGLLPTPEILRWRDVKTPPSPPEEYIQVSRRCCFTELAEDEVERHSQYFGPFVLEFDHKTLCDLGAMPVIYIPRMSDYEDYGVGPAIVTQLAHIQDAMTRMAALKQFGRKATDQNPEGLVIARPTQDSGLMLLVDGIDLSCTIPRAIIDRARVMKPGFELPKVPPEGAPLGLTAGGLLNLMNIMTWGLHEPDVLTGMVKGMASIVYPTERPQDPLLSYYQQREWRIIGGLLRDNVRVTSDVSNGLRDRLLKLDREFFGRELQLPTGLSILVDQCEVFSKKHSGEAILTLARKIICPPESMEDVRALLRGNALEVTTFRDLSCEA